MEAQGTRRGEKQRAVVTVTAGVINVAAELVVRVCLLAGVVWHHLLDRGGDCEKLLVRESSDVIGLKGRLELELQLYRRETGRGGREGGEGKSQWEDEEKVRGHQERENGRGSGRG